MSLTLLILERNKLTLLDVTTQASPPHPTASLLNLLNRLS